MVGDAPVPVVDDQVVLHGCAPENGVFESALHPGVVAALRDLLPGGQAVAADPDAAAAADHEKRAVLALGETQVREALNDPPVAGVEIEFLLFPRALEIVGKVIGVDYIENVAAVLEAIGLGVVTAADDLRDLVGSEAVGGHGADDFRAGPGHVAFGVVFGPAADEEMERAIWAAKDVAAPIGPSWILDPVEDVARFDGIHTPRLGGARPEQRHGFEEVHETSAEREVLPFGRALDILVLGGRGKRERGAEEDRDSWQNVKAPQLHQRRLVGIIHLPPARDTLIPAPQERNVYRGCYEFRCNGLII